MSRLVIVLCALVSMTLAAPGIENEVIEIVKQRVAEPAPDGSYSFEYETANGIQVSEEAQVRAQGDELLKEVTGTFTYTSPDGTPIRVTYTADANGFHPEGSHLPVPPEIPVHIQRALEYIATHPQANVEN
ncbi:PREDICTED: endocuticle structural glycoprotein SgAbd-8-like isoform X2 [Polistes dominula]|uniref:Endocuticle structural glycoprotein SgAbd-8-like isoform X2 n=1 Tax=Polistes dominula TaxID=743375 RepID=A0ABM1IKZ7_POLDO|nr:PREDICTED: endocuticle structural glycoprotein SgAbd-8-like isoform X2 [Polistes dominula]XP_015180884.1 PREDICTED: endocuticle structural glycoprotein SgAbd-8-like isoform X2 [Polistes dominula]